MTESPAARHRHRSRSPAAPVAGGFGRDQVDAWCERGILGLVLAILVFAPLALGAVRLQEFVVIEWLTLAILAIWFIRFLVNPKHRLLWPAINWGVLAFTLYAVARYFTSDLEYVGRQELARVLVYASLYFAIVHNLHRQETTHLVVMVLLGLGALLAFYGLYQNLGDSNSVWGVARSPAYLRRGSGTFYCPDHLAGYLAMLLPLGLACLLSGRFSHLLKVFFGYAVFVMAAGLVVTFSRAAWLASGIGAVVLLIWLARHHSYRWQAFLALGALLVVGCALVWTAKASPHRLNQLVLQPQQQQAHLDIWQAAGKMWRDHQLFGVGPGHFDARFPQYRPATPTAQVRPDRAHNDLLNLLADWGSVGAVLVVATLGLFFWQVARSWKHVQRGQNDLNAKRSNKSAIVMGGSIGTLSLLLLSLADFNLQIPANAILFVALLALVSGHFRFASERFWHTVRWPLRIPVTLGLLAVMAFLSWQTWRATSEAHWLKRARKSAYASAAFSAGVQQAIAVEGNNFATAYALGEMLRTQSWELPDDYRERARQAIAWFERSNRLNPFDPLPHLRRGMCQDWIGEHTTALQAYEVGRQLDPNGYFPQTLLGWHYLQVGDLEKAREAFERSLRLNSQNNPIALKSYPLVMERLQEERLAPRTK